MQGEISWKAKQESLICDPNSEPGGEITRHSQFLPFFLFSQASFLSKRGPVSGMISFTGQRGDEKKVGLEGVELFTHGIPASLIQL